VNISREAWEALDRYGYDGKHTGGWATAYVHFERLLHLLRLRIEQRRRNGPLLDTKRIEAPMERLFDLRLEKWCGIVGADAERQALACEALGIECPLEQPGHVDADLETQIRREAILVEARERAAVMHPRGCQRQWRWPHERPSSAYDLRPVVYYADWDPETHQDFYGSADRWAPGETVVVSADEIPVEAKPVAPKPASRYEGEARAELNDGIEDAEVVDEPASSTTEPLPERSRSALVVRGGWRTLGTLENGAFRPNTMDPFSR
jgi:hypothetical protein